MSSPARTEEDVTTILMALVAWAGQVKPAADYLKAEKGIAIAPATLQNWKTRYGERYDSLRDEHRSSLEARLVNEMGEVAVMATQVERLALERARERLEAGKDDDPSRTAANVSRVKTSSVDKVNNLLGRPTTIHENRDATALLRSLVERGVLIAPEEPKEIEAAGDGVDAR